LRHKRGVEIYLHTFLVSSVVGGKCPLPSKERRSPGIPRGGGWAREKAGLEAFEKKIPL